MTSKAYLGMAIVIAGALAFSACGDDEDDNNGTAGSGAGSGTAGTSGGSGGTGGAGGAGGTGGVAGSDDDAGAADGGSEAGTGSAAIDPTPFAGDWTGEWENTTFASTGDASLTVTPNTADQTVSFTLDLDGNVFGGNDPAAETFTGPYDADGYTVTGDSDTFGTLTLSISKAGVITGSATPSRGATTLTGTATESLLTINYAIADAPNPDIEGVLTFTK